MKLLKKLLPIAAVTSTVAIVAPIVTSCGIASGSFSTNIDPEKGQEKYYESKIAVKPAGQFDTPALAEKTYFEDVAKNPMILIDDALYDSFAKTKSVNVDKKSDITFISISVRISKFDAEKKTVSCKTVYKTKGNIVDGEKKTPIEIAATFDYKDVPVTLYSESGATLFEFAPISTTELLKDANWSIKAKATGKQIDEDEHGKVITKMEAEDIFNKDHMFEQGEYPISPLVLITFYSHYFSQQEVK